MAATSGESSTPEHKSPTQRREEQEADDRRKNPSQSQSPASADDPSTLQAATGRNHDCEDEEEQTRSKPGNERVLIEALLQDVESWKNRGNVEFLKGRALSKHTAGRNILSDACLLYAEGIRALAKVEARLSEGDSNATGNADGCRDEEDTVAAKLFSRAESLGSALYLNLAAVNLLLNEWAPALACCTHVIETTCRDAIAAAAGAVETAAPASLGPEARQGQGEGTVDRLNEVAAKALYRRSAARLGIGRDEEAIAARNDLVLALKLKPGDADVQRELAKVEKTIASAQAKEKLRRETEEGRRRNQRRGKANEVTRVEESVSRRPDASTAPTSTQPGVNNDEAVASPSRTPAKSETPGDGDVVADDGVEGGHGRSTGGDNREGRYDGKSTSERLDTEGRAERLGAEKRSKERVEEGEEQFPTWNGGESRNGLYAWNQSVFEVQVCVRVPVWAQAKDVRVDMRRLRLSVRIVSPRKPQSAAGLTAAARIDIDPTNIGDDRKTPAAGICEDVTTIILDGTLSRPVQAGECLWTFEKPGRVCLYLQKELAAEGEPGYEWWDRVIDGDEGIDTSQCDAGCFASAYPEHVRRRGAKALWDHQRKSPAQRRTDELNEARMREARRQVEMDADQRQRDLDKALKDPKKAEMYRQLQKALPNTTISLK